MTSGTSSKPESAPEPDPVFEDAVARHRAGNLAGAEAGYLEVLERVPEHPHALHFLGVALHQQRRYPEALSRLEQAAKALPRAPAVHSNLGNTLRALGRHPQAILAYEKALDLDPKFADASNNLGITLQELKRPDAAVEAYRQALAAGGGVNVSRNLASALRQARRFEEARAVCRAALDAHPDDAEMHRVLGNLELDLGHWTDAASSLERARELGAEDGDLLLSLGHALRKAKQRDRALGHLERARALRPDDPDVWNNLGAVHQDAEAFDQATACYRKALELEPEHVWAHNNLGSLLHVLGENEAAVGLLRRAVSRKPDYADAWLNLGLAFQDLALADDAEEAFREAVRLNPGLDEAQYALGMLQYRRGNCAGAEGAFAAWLEHSPENPVARHMLAATSGRNVPERASDGFVTRMFDEFAPSFDLKLEQLQYRAPDVLATRVARWTDRPAELHVLDAGCGTGLCAPALRPLARRLDGVDLSGGMVERARERGLYDALHVAELTAYLKAHPGTYDAVVAADTLVYFGSLDAVLGAARTALRPGGRLFFTLEAGDPVLAEGFRLEPHGRYAHAPSYLKTALAGAGLTLLSLETEPVRLERGEPVNALVVVAGPSESGS